MQREAERVMIYTDLPVEVQRLLNEVVHDLYTTRVHIDSRNYGLAGEWIDVALSLLPRDNGSSVQT